MTKVRVRNNDNQLRELLKTSLADILFKHLERTLPNCVLPSSDPHYTEWTSLDKKLDAVGADAKFVVNLQMIPVARLF